MAEQELGRIGQRAESLAEVLRAVAHPLRLRIIELLSARDATVSEMVEILEAKQTVISQHLKGLRQLGLVSVKRQGGWATYSLAEPQLRELMACLVGCHRR